MKLDRKRHFGEVFGNAPYKYEQDGKYFDADGNEVTANGKPVKETDHVDGK
jgi:hypothetical protein